MFMMLASPDGKKRMLLNAEQVFGFVESDDGSVHAVSITGHTIAMPVDLDTLAESLDSEGEDDETE